MPQLFLPLFIYAEMPNQPHWGGQGYLLQSPPRIFWLCHYCRYWNDTYASYLWKLLTQLPLQVTFLSMSLWWRFKNYFRLFTEMHKVTNCHGYGVHCYTAWG